MKISAVVVTYNRKNLLLECVQAIRAQSRPVDEIVILDNASTDGTESFLKEKDIIGLPEVVYVRKDVNTGGSGGFYYGSKQAYKGDADWIWMMDDDCIPTKTALEELVKATEITEASFLCSAVYSPEGGMNNPPSVESSSFWYQYTEYGMVSVNSATFVSFFVNRKAVEKCGLPYKEFFIWHDDMEYSERLTKYYGPGYLVSKSKVVHKISPERHSEMTNINRIKRLHYGIRNSLVVSKEYGTYKTVLKTHWIFLKWFFRFLFKNKHYRLRKAMQVVKGEWGFYTGSYDRKKFKKRFTNHCDEED